MIITQTKFETHFDRYLELVSKEKIIITKNGKRLAVLTGTNEVMLEEAKFLVVSEEEID